MSNIVNSSEAIAIIIIGGGAIISFVTPILKLNTSIVTLTNTIESFKERFSHQQKTLDKHNNEIDVLKFDTLENKHILANHETRLKSLEHKSNNQG